MSDDADRLEQLLDVALAALRSGDAEETIATLQSANEVAQRLPKKEPPTVTREIIMTTVSDLALDLLDYDRREDDELPPGAIQAAIKSGVITVEDIVAEFARALAEELGDV